MGIFDWLFGGKKTNSSEEIKKKQDERRSLEIKHQKLKEQVDLLVNEFEKKMESVYKWYEIIKYRADFLLDIPEEDEQETRSNYFKEDCLTKYNEGDSNKDEIILNIEKFEFINTEAGNLFKSISEITVPNYPFDYKVTWLAKYHRASKASITGEKMALKVINGEADVSDLKMSSEKSRKRLTYFLRSGENGENVQELESVSSILGFNNEFYKLSDWEQIKTLLKALKKAKNDTVFGTWIANEFRFMEYSFKNEFKLKFAEQIMMYYRNDLSMQGLKEYFDNNVIWKKTEVSKKDNLEEFKESINLFINNMKKMPDWYEIIQARGNGHAMFAKTMNIKVDDYEYWANAHKEEYMQKYNDGNLDVEGINSRIEKFGFIVTELEKVIKKAAELNLNITHEMHNDYCAARASVLGAEYALKEMSK